MANPLSDRGWSDRDYQAAIGTLVGEAAAKGNLRDFQAIADVIANRAAAGVYGKSIAGITMNPSEFSTWSTSKKTAEARKSAMAGFAAALNPAATSRLSSAMQQRVEMAKQALTDVNVTGVARGLTQGATAYHNSQVTRRDKTSGWHDMLEDKYGATKIGAHTFTGPGFRPGDTFDPITYNGQLAAPKAADTYFGDVMFGEKPVDPVPIGQVTASSIPDITPAREAGFSWDLSGATLPSDLSLDFAAPMDMGTFNDIFDTGFNRTQAPSSLMDLESFTPFDTAPVDLSDVRRGMTESQALSNLGLDGQRLSDNVEVRYGSKSYGDDIDTAIAAQEMANREADFGVAVGAGHYPGYSPENPLSSAALSAVNAFEANPASVPQRDWSDITAGIFDAPMSLESFAPIDTAPVDFSGVRQGLTEAQAIANLGLENQRLSDNVEVRHGSYGYGDDIDTAIAMQKAAGYKNDQLATDYGSIVPGTELDRANIETVWDRPAEKYRPDPALAGPFADASFITEGILHDAPVAAPAKAGGFSAGVDAGPWGVTPDFSAPSLERRNAEAFNQSAVRDLQSDIRSLEQSIAANELANGAWNEKVASSPTLGGFDTTKTGIRDQEAALGITPDINRFDAAFAAMPDLGTFGSMPSMVSMQGPSLAPAPIETVTAPTTTASVVPQGDFDEFGENFPGASAAPAQRASAQRASAPAPQRAAPSAPAQVPSFSLPETAPMPPSRTQMEISKQFDLPSFDLPSFDLPDIGLPTARDIGTTIGMSPQTMDTIGNFMDSRLGKAATGAGIGFVTGGPIGAVTNGTWSGLGIGDMFSNAFDRYANAYANLSPANFAAFGLDGNWTDREPTFNTGYGEAPGGIGDGSFSEHAGWNDNSPQGIL